MTKLKTETKTLTHTAILCLAIRCCEQDLQHWENQKLTPEQLEFMTEDLQWKLDTLKQLYKLETGTEY